MAVQTATILKSYFNTGDTPTEVQFADLIDSSVNTGLLDETAHGALDHTGLTGIPAAYSLPTASTTILGGVKVDGTTVTITDGVISSSGSGMTNPMTAAGDIIIGGTSGAPTRLAKGTDGQVLTVVAGVPAYADASGGSATIDWTSPVVVTDTATLVYGKHYIVAVTAADKTLTLPEITAADYGKMIVVEIAAATTKLITIDGYATQAIDGTATRAMWASEVAQLVATANGWAKIGGKSIPMSCKLRPSAGQLFESSVEVLINCDTNLSANSLMASTDNYKSICRRQGTYIARAGLQYNNTNVSTTNRLFAYFAINGAIQYEQAVSSTVYASSYFAISTTGFFSLAAGDFVQLYGYYSTGSFTTKTVLGYNDAPTSGSSLSLQEVPSW